jgi:transcriptional regulator with PAS, ATPase and Fis domain
VIGHGCIIADGDFIDIHNLPEHLSIRQDPGTVEGGKKEIVSLMEMKQRYAREVVDQVKNKAQAAHLLGISRTMLYRLLSKKSNDEYEDNG